MRAVRFSPFFRWRDRCPTSSPFFSFFSDLMSDGVRVWSTNSRKNSHVLFLLPFSQVFSFVLVTFTLHLQFKYLKIPRLLWRNIL